MYMYSFVLNFTASNVRCDGSNCCRGCGPQEQFYGCSDITIKANGSPNKPPVYIQPVPTQQPLPGNANNGGNGAIPASFQPILPEYIGVPMQPVSECKGTAEFRAGNAAADDWCIRHCANGYCPKEYCSDQCRGKSPLLPVTNVCKAKQFWREKYDVPAAADKWCKDTCSRGHCPFEYCESDCWSLRF